jgi:hypothetical protein
VKGIGGIVDFLAGRAGPHNLREIFRRGRKGDNDVSGSSAREVVGELLDVIGSDLIELGQLSIAAMKRTTGEGDPDNGELFGQGKARFNQVDDMLASAVPSDSWDGSGSHAYADQNTRQQLRSETLAEADREVHKVLVKESLQIKLRRGFLDDQSNFLAKTSYVTFPLQFIPRYGEAAKLVIELAALQTALGESSYQLYQLHSEVTENAAELRQTIGRYSGVAERAVPPGGGLYFSYPPKPPGDGSAPQLPPETDNSSGGPPGQSSPAICPPAGPGGDPSDGAEPTCGGPEAGPIDQAPPVLPNLPPTPSPPATPGLGGAPSAASGSVVGGAIGSLLGALGGLIAGATQAAGQGATTPPQPVTANGATTVDGTAKNKTERPTGDDARPDANEPDEKDPDRAAPGDGHSERAPVHVAADADPDQPPAPVTVRLGPDNAPGSPAATRPQHKN